MCSREQYIRSLHLKALTPEKTEKLNQGAIDEDPYGLIDCTIRTVSMDESTGIARACKSVVKHDFHYSSLLE